MNEEPPNKHGVVSRNAVPNHDLPSDTPRCYDEFFLKLTIAAFHIGVESHSIIGV